MKKPILLFLMLISVLGIGYVASFFLMTKSSESESIRKVPPFRKDGELIFTKPSDSSFNKVIDLEIADEAWEIQQGLMYRTKMGESQGMLFKMPIEKEQSFWMKNTNIPLDIFYVNSSKEIVSIQKYTTPHSEEQLLSEAPAQFVVEVNAGFADTYDLKKGDKVSF